MSSEETRQARTRYKVTFPLAPETPFYRKVQVIQRSGALDIAVVPVRGEIANLDTLYATGAPVQIEWENAYGTGLFVGYVHHHSPDFDQLSPWIDVVCVGAAYPMLVQKQRVFEYTTADHVARTLASEHGLSAETDQHSRIYQSLAQPGISDWALLRKLADDTGYVLRLEGTCLQFVKRARADAYYRPRAQVFQRKTHPTINLTRVSEVVSFKPLVGDLMAESPNTAKSITQMNPLSAGTLTISRYPEGASAASAQFTTPTGRIAADWSEATTLLEAAVENNRFVYRAKATLHGNPYVAPERLIYLQGMDGAYGGYWTVLSARHRVNGAHNYFVDVELGSDGLHGESGVVPFWESVDDEQLLNTHRTSRLRVDADASTALGRAQWVSTVVSNG